MNGPYLWVRTLILGLVALSAGANRMSSHLPSEINVSRRLRQSGDPILPAGGFGEGERDSEEPLGEKEVLRRILEEKEELLSRIGTLERANRELTLANSVIDRAPSDGRIGNTRPADCADHFVMGANRSGIYEIYPFTEPLRVYCDMETDGGGWTVFMTRQPADVPLGFNRSWSEYRSGFGDASGEFWLGNAHLHTMTSSREYALRMDAHLASGDVKFSAWNFFRVSTEVDRFRLSLSAYSDESTSRSNCLPNVNGRFFTTYDRDYDETTGNCAVTQGGGFWHYLCSNPVHPTASRSEGLTSACFSNQQDAAVFLQLKIRPVICGTSVKTIFLNANDCNKCP
ncbi:angiopoietin-4-like isoform X2 [Macrobrachium rosenbergii]|uniref:angiopoietin-4-like isoform X2 n=1 Tax=Macrobrachium rosenbergii TaxID=79674 RepID=UPI0034D5FECA